MQAAIQFCGVTASTTSRLSAPRIIPVPKLPPNSVPPKKKQKPRLIARGPRRIRRKVVAFCDRALVDMAVFFRQTDWAAWWEEFYLSVNTDGRALYRTIIQFAKAKRESQDQEDFLRWYLGPPADKDPKYTFVDKPVDWAKRRDEGGWFSKANLKTAAAELSRRFGVLDKMQLVGEKFGTQFLERAAALAQRWDEETRGSFFVNGLSIQQNENRAKMLLDMHMKIQNYYDNAQRSYFLSLGVNLEDISGLVTLMTAAAQQKALTAEDGQPQSRGETALRAFVELTMSKAARYQLPMPPEIEDTVVEAVVEQEERVFLKKKVQ